MGLGSQIVLSSSDQLPGTSTCAGLQLCCSVSAGLTISHAPILLRVDMAAPDSSSKGARAGKGAKRSGQPPVEPGKSRAQMIIAAALNEAKEELSRSKSNALPSEHLLEAGTGRTYPCIYMEVQKGLTWLRGPA